jgi:transposase-like protein
MTDRGIWAASKRLIVSRTTSLRAVTAYIDWLRSPPEPGVGTASTSTVASST